MSCEKVFISYSQSKQGSKQVQVVNMDLRDRTITLIKKRLEVLHRRESTFLEGCQTDVTKRASVHEYEPAAFTAITVSVTLIQTALYHRETPEEESQPTAGLIMSVSHTQTHGRIRRFTGAQKTNPLQ